MPADGQGRIECRLESAHDLAALLSALQLREKDQKDQRVHCEASSRGLKFTAMSGAKEVAVLGWMFENAFKEYRYTGDAQELHIRLPVAPLLNCLQIFSDRASLVLRYPEGPSDELFFTLEEDGAVTEVRLKTFTLDEAPAPLAAGFFGPGDPLALFRPTQPEVWHAALSEFADLDAPDVALQVTLRNGTEGDPAAPCVVLQATTLTSDAEVELPRGAFEEFTLPPEVAPTGQLVSRYPLTSVLASCLRASKDAKAVKVRLNREGIMSTQFILRGRKQKDLFCEALVTPLADRGGGPAGSGFAGTQRAARSRSPRGSVAASAPPSGRGGGPATPGGPYAAF